MAKLPYSKGIWTHSFDDGRPADVVIDISGQDFVRFKSHVGVPTADDRASVQFQILLDQQIVVESPVIRGDVTHHFDVDVTDGKELVLRVLNGGDGHGFDHSTWGIARFVRKDYEDPLEVPGEIGSLVETTIALYLAATHRCLNNSDLAERWYTAAAAWLENNRPTDPQVLLLRDDVAEVLELP